MANLTISVDKDTLRRARIRALEHRTSVNAVVQDFLEHYAGVSASSAALAGFREKAAAARASSGSGGRTWERGDLHERPGLR